MSRSLAALALLALCGGCSGSGQSEAALQRTIRIGRGSAAEAGVVYWKGRTRVHDGPRRRLIFDLDAKTVTFIDKGARTYVVRTLDEVMRKRKIRRPEPNTIAADLILTATDKREQIAGYTAREYTFASGRVRGSVWVADGLSPPPEWREWEPVIASLEGAFAGGEEIIKAVTDLKGYPLRTELRFVGSGDEANVLTQVSAVTLGPPSVDLTIVPADYRRASDPAIPDLPIPDNIQIPDDLPMPDDQTFLAKTEWFS